MTERDSLLKNLKDIQQEHLLRYLPELKEQEQEELLNQIREIDFSYMEEFSKKESPSQRGSITPISALPRSEIKNRYEEFYRTGAAEIKKGGLALVLLAGGMGTRLGYEGPKGTFNIGETKEVFIFQRLIENLMDVTGKLETKLHLFIMTSQKNDSQTRDFFREHQYFGYNADYIHFFIQDMAPVVSEEGKVLLEAKHKIQTSPNGNGGWFLSLMKSGYGRILEEEQIRWLNVFAVDNVLQKIADPAFLGAVMLGGQNSGSKVVRKADRNEKVGVMCLEDNKPSVIEYIEMTDAMLDETDEYGEPSYNFGVILNYLFSVEKLREIMHTSIPVHFAHKKVPYLNEQGETVVPTEENAWKFEYFILDQIQEMGSCLPYEVVREQEFAPVKNLHGTDSVDTARQLCRLNHISL